ncbi:MAG: hypothetical protein CVV14_09950 [Gammaproteobacteria bacterium HGW-Gammaproteobacteria-4]|jgi:preprotein translocase subunit Sec63|nr:MAG: hypothetical protein CVV14_09950 [Gammaproteobacteria bacterium HGW-Gammaproteobacteria-4]
MRWYGKALGAVLGLVLLRSPFGLLIGLLVGHILDADWLSTRKDDPYRVLGIDASANDAEVEQAYRRLMAQYHPDRVAGAGEELRELAGRRASAINAAYDAIQKLRRRGKR